MYLCEVALIDESFKYRKRVQKFLGKEKVIFLFIYLQTKELSGRVFQHLCEVVDDQSGKYHRKIVNIAKDIILDGKIFPPV